MDKHPLEHKPDTHWPLYVPIVCAAIVAVNTAVAMFQPRFEGYSLAWGALAGAFIVGPFVTDAIGAFIHPAPPRVWLAVFPVPVAIGVSYFMWHPAEVDVAPFILVFMVGEMVSRSRGLLGVAVLSGVLAVATIIVAEVAGPWDTGASIWVAGIAFGWLGGFLIRELETRTHELEEAQAGLAEKAAADERSRIAREVHDVIAHSLSVTMLHVTAARMALEKGDRTNDAIDALREAEEQGRRSLNEVRRTVGLLGGDGGASAAPMPLANDLPRLVADFRNAGLDITLRMDGDVQSLPAAAGLGLYRIVQESLTNVAKHAPSAKTEVDLDVDDRDIRLRVHNGLVNGKVAPTPDAGGLGLRGMAERAALLGGTFKTLNGDGGWTVLVEAPRPTADAT